MAFKMRGFSGFKSKQNKGGYHKGQVSDAKREEMNDNVAMGKGPKKMKHLLHSKRKSVGRGPHPDSDQHIGAVPTFSDHVRAAMNNKKNKK